MFDGADRLLPDGVPNLAAKLAGDAFAAETGGLHRADPRVVADQMVQVAGGLKLGHGQEGRPSFLKKRSKKLLNTNARVATGIRAFIQKFFGSFFQKRTAFLPKCQ
jgi:hypothetical protein